MAIAPQKLREIVFQLLYSRDMADAESADLLPLMMHELAVTRRIVQQALDRVDLIRAELPTIDQQIGDMASSYEFERIPRVERNILRLAVFELLYDPSVPPKVAIAEAIRLTRKFATPEAATFINAVLDAIFKMQKGEAVDSNAIVQAITPLDVAEESPPALEDSCGSEPASS
jgi:N utilization substance protein B